MASVIIRPSGVGTYSDFSTIFGAATSWQCVNEVVADNDATYIETGEGNNYSTFAHTAAGLTGSETINSVVVTVDCRYILGAGILNNDFGVVLVVGGNLDNQFDGLLTTSYQTVSHTYIVSPDTGLAWTKTEIDNMEIGVFTTVFSSGGLETPRCTQIYATINYTSGSTTKKIGLLGVG